MMSDPVRSQDQGGLAQASTLMARVLGVACGLVLLSMMSLTGADVLARYLFNAPIKGAFELVEVMMVLLVYLAFPLAILAHAHVEVELWEPKSKLSNRLRIILASLCGLAVFSVFSVELFEHAQKYAKRETVTNSLGLPLKYIAFAAMIGTAACVIFTITTMIERLKSK